MKVFDTSAVLAVMYDEDGRERAEDDLDGSVISTVNMAEVLRDVMALRGASVETAARMFSRLPLRVIPPDESQAKRVAVLKAVRGLSLGDCFCIALGEARRAPLVTADTQWVGLDLSVPVELIR